MKILSFLVFLFFSSFSYAVVIAPEVYNTSITDVTSLLSQLKGDQFFYFSCRVNRNESLEVVVEKNLVAPGYANVLMQKKAWDGDLMGNPAVAIIDMELHVLRQSFALYADLTHSGDGYAYIYLKEFEGLTGTTYVGQLDINLKGYSSINTENAVSETPCIFLR